MTRTTKRTDGTTVTYEDVTDTAKRVRAALKEAFPGVKFSVRCDRSSMSASIDVSWLNGPLQAQVERVVGKFRSTGPMDMSDYVPIRTHELDGKLIVFGAKYVSTHRSVSMTVRDAIAQLDDGEMITLARRLDMRPQSYDIDAEGALRFRGEFAGRLARYLPVWKGEQRPCPSAEGITIVSER